jgi:Leucine-rich repeat (LRR) protein
MGKRVKMQFALLDTKGTIWRHMKHHSTISTTIPTLKKNSMKSSKTQDEINCMLIIVRSTLERVHFIFDIVFVFLCLSSATIDYSHQNLSDVDAKHLLNMNNNYQNITNIQCDSASLTIWPIDINRFQSLITIELSNNRLVQIPCEIGLLKYLKNLYLKNNLLDDLSLPKGVEHLKQLEVINLGGNRFKQFPWQLFQMLNLREIYLGSNQIVSLPNLFGTLEK